MTWDLDAAHRNCSQHRTEIEASTLCGCFCCCATYPPGEIHRWMDKEQTATCPRCGIDSVLGDASGWPVADPAFLHAMQTAWFATASAEDGPGE